MVIPQVYLRSSFDFDRLTDAGSRERVRLELIAHFDKRG